MKSVNSLNFGQLNQKKTRTGSATPKLTVSYHTCVSTCRAYSDSPSPAKLSTKMKKKKQNTKVKTHSPLTVSQSP